MDLKSQRSDGTEEYDPEKAESNGKNSSSGEISFVEDDPDLMDESVPMSQIAVKNKKEITQIKTQQSASSRPNIAFSCTSGLSMCGRQQNTAMPTTSSQHNMPLVSESNPNPQLIKTAHFKQQCKVLLVLNNLMQHSTLFSNSNRMIHQFA